MWYRDLVIPYWMVTRELSSVVNVKQVSAHEGGDLKIQFDMVEQGLRWRGKSGQRITS
jgi:hypothetical protein